MILENFCNQVTEEYLRSQNERLIGYENPNAFYTELSLGSRIEYANDAYSTMQELKQFDIPECYEDLMKMVRKEMEADFIIQSKRVEEAARRRQGSLDAIASRRKVTMKDAERVLKEKESQLFASMQNIVSKHSSIPRDKLEEIIRLYKLPVGKTKINTKALSLKELEDMIDLAHYAATTTVGDKSVTDRLLSVFYLPLLDKTSDENLAFTAKISHFIVLLILCYLLKPYFMAIVGFTYLTHFLSKLYSIYEREELLCAAYEISEAIDFAGFVYENPEYIELQKQLEALEFEDDALSCEEVERQYRKELEEIRKDDPQLQFDELQKEYNIRMTDFLQEFEKATNQIRDKHKMLVRLHENHIEAVDKHFSELKKNMSMLGSTISTQRTMSTRFKIGSAKYKDEVVAEADIEIPQTNINFLYNSEGHKQELINFSKLLLTNAFCNVKEKHLKVTIYDPLDLGKDYSEFLDIKLTDYVQVITSDFKKLTENLLTDSKNSIASFRQKDIQQFNSDAEELGKITKDYHILIIASHDGDLTKEKQFASFMKYSAKYGIWVWNIMSSKTSFGENKEDKADYENFLKDLTICSEAGVLQTQSGELGGFDSPLSLYKYTPDLGANMIQELLRVIDENRVDILPYESGYRLKHLPDDKIWTYSTLKGIEIHPGLLDGDPDNCLPHIFGDDTVHALMGGATGQGKSATINEMLTTILMMYPPEELELVMVDFKNVEFKMYTGDLLIPHAKIIAGTKDGEYALSIFDYLMEEMTRRSRLFGENKVQKLEEYNKLMLAKGRRDLYLPRILLLIDEFQVMFTEVELKMVDKIKERITSLAKLARFCGCHMWFTSQSMKNTMSADILEQFKLRMSLFATKETSSDLIGNTAASTLKGKGWIYTNDSGAQNPNANRLFRVPFASNDYIKEYLPKLIQKGKNEGRLHRHAVFYDEEKIHSYVDLISIYDTHPELRKRLGTFILGERTMYSTNPLPYGITITKDDAEHVLATCFERESLLNLTNTFIENCIQREVDYCVHSADKESTKLLGLVDRVPEDYRALVEEPVTCEDILEMLEDLIKGREDEGVELNHPEFNFITVNWEKLIGLGRDDKYQYQERFKSILQRAGQVNVHLVMVMRDTSNFKQWNSTINHRIISKCSERESGYLTDTDKGTKIDKVFGIHMYGSEMVKFKIYQFPLRGEVLQREVKLTA